MKGTFTVRLAFLSVKTTLQSLLLLLQFVARILTKDFKQVSRFSRLFDLNHDLICFFLILTFPFVQVTVYISGKADFNNRY